MNRKTPKVLLSAVVLLAAWSTSADIAAANTRLVRQGTPHDILYGIAAGNSGLLAVGTAGLLLRSTDGESWEYDQLPTDGRSLFSVATAGALSVAVGQEGIILVNTDPAGMPGSWETVPSPTTERLFSVAVDNSGNAAAVGSFGTVLVSTSSGRHWRALAIDWEKLIDQPYEPHIYKVAFDQQGRLLISGEFGMIARSEDLGESWTLLRKGDASVFDLTLSGASTIYAVGQDGEVLHSADAGRNWRRIETTTNGVLLDAVLQEGNRLTVFGLRENLKHKKESTEILESAQPDSELGNGWYTDSAVFRNAHYIVGQQGRIVRIDD